MVFPESRIAIIKQVVGFKITGFCLSNLSMSFRFIGNWILWKAKASDCFPNVLEIHSGLITSRFTL